MKRCSMCGGSDKPLHRYGTASAYSSTPGKPLYACSSCDPITPMLHRNELKALTDDICDRSDGNPGAINVMCSGVLCHGKTFYDALARHNLRGSSIWIVFKDMSGSSLNAMMERLESSEPIVLPYQ